MKRRILLIIVCCIVVGFASIATTLYFSSDIKISANETDFDVYFSAAIIDGVDKTNIVIDGDKTSITFNSKELKTINDESVLEYTIANNSSQYDVAIDVTVNKLSDTNYTKLTNIIDTDSPLESKSVRNGKATIKLLKFYMGESDEIDEQYRIDIVATPIEKTEIDRREITNNELTAYGIIKDNDNNLLSYQTLVIYSDTPHFVKTDFRGMFYVKDIEPGEHEVYVLGDVEIDDTLRSKTKDEISDMSLSRETFNTGSSTSTSNNKYTIENIRTFITGKTIKEVILDTNGGLGNNELIYVVDGEEIGYIPGFDHETLDFDSWSTNPDDGEKIDYDKSYDYEDIDKLYATYKDGLVEVNGVVYSNFKRAYDSINTTDETIMKLLGNQSIGVSINNDKSIVIDLNNFAFDMSGYIFTNNNNISVSNGLLKTNTLNMFVNNNNMTINNVNINISGSLDNEYAIKTENNSITNFNDVLVTLEFSNESGLLLSNGTVNINGDHFEINENGTNIKVIKNLGLLNVNCKNVVGNVDSLFENNGTLNIGDTTSEIEPIITSRKDVIDNKSGTLNIYKGKFNSQENKIILLSGDGKANLYGGTYNSNYVTIETLGNSELNIYDGYYSSAGNYAIATRENGIVNIYGGTYLSTKSGAITSRQDSILNILGDIEILDSGTQYYQIYNQSTLNIKKGTLNLNNNFGVSNNGTMNIGSPESSDTPVIIADMGSISSDGGVTNIYNGIFQALIGNSFNIRQTGIVNIYNGQFHSGNAVPIVVSDTATLNVLGDIDIEGNENSKYSIYNNNAIINIVNGNIRFNNYAGILNTGTLNIGSDDLDNIPNLISELDTIEGRNGIINIYKGFFQSKGATNNVIFLKENGKANLYNGTYKSVSSSINIKADSELNIYDGNYSSEEAYALITKEDSVANLYGGTYNSTNSNSISSQGNSVLNILDSINILENKSTSYAIYNIATLNILKGIVNFNDNYGIGNYGTVNIGLQDSEEIPVLLSTKSTITSRKGVVNINNVNVQTSDGYSLYLYDDGKANVYGGKYYSATTNTMYVKGNGELNVLGDIEIQYNGTTSYALYNSAITNILKGTIEFNSNPGIGNAGTLNIGLSDSLDIPLLQGNNNLIAARGGVINIYKINLQTTSGNALVVLNGIVNAYGGTYYSKTSNTIFVNESGILNILGDIEILNNGSSSYSIVNRATTNILKGTVNLNDNVGLINYGTLNIGSLELDDIPKLISNSTLLYIRDGEANIYKADLAASLYAIDVFEKGKANIYGGTYYSKTSNALYVIGNGELNILGDIEILDNGTTSYALYNNATTNILKGTVKFNGNPGIGSIGLLNIGSQDLDEEPILMGNTIVCQINNGNLNVYKGTIKSKNNKAITLYGTSKANIYGGTYYSENDSAILIPVNSEFNVLGNMEILKNEKNKCGFLNDGTLNILKGTINLHNNPGIISTGTLNIGSLEMTEEPIINNDNALIMHDSGEVNIYKGKLQISSGIVLNSNNNGIVNLYGGSYYSGDSTPIYADGNTELNILGDIEIVPDKINEIALYNSATTNIIKGTIKLNGNRGIVNLGTLNIGSLESIEEPTIINDNNLIHILNGNINVFKGLLQSNNGTAIKIYDGGEANLYGGTYESKNANTFIISPNSELNVLGDIEIFDNEHEYYCFNNSGVLNILKGTINMNNNPGIISSGMLNIGLLESDNVPRFLANSNVVDINDGEANIYNGYFETTKGSIINGTDSGKINVYGGTYYNSGTSTTFYNTDDAVFNILGNIEMLDNGTTSMNVINYGTMNILKGIINFNNNPGIVNFKTLNVGSMETADIPEIYSGYNAIEGRDGIVNIYKGKIKSKNQNACSIYENGILNVYGGELISSVKEQAVIYNNTTTYLYGGTLTNLEGGYTFYNNGGTAIQYGGVSPKNYNVTVG